MKIAVCMIVCNESKIITRCLDSFSQYISAYIINDNEPDATTTPVIDEYFKSKNIPGKIYHDKWVDFGYNRSLILEYGRKYIKNVLKEDPKKWYLLMVDADYILNINNPYWVDKLTLPNYSFRHIEQYFDYSECILFRADKQWKYACVTHEYPYLQNDHYSLNVNMDISIKHFCDGGTRSIKFERDIDLITRELQKNIPLGHKERYYFYLAQSYNNINDYKNAIIYYKKRINCGGWDEELYFSMYKIGECRLQLAENLEEKMEAIKDLMDAYYYRPQRLEALYSAAEAFSTIDMGQLSIPLLKLCISTPYPHNDHLFIVKDIYEWKALYLYTLLLISNDLKEKHLYVYLCEKNDNMPDDYKIFLRNKL